MKSKKLIRKLGKKIPLLTKTLMDVTGGMSRKVEESSIIAKSGIDVFFVNGNKPQRIVDAVKRKKFNGTLVRG